MPTLLLYLQLFFCYSVLSRVLEPVIVIEIKLSDDRKEVFEVSRTFLLKCI